MLAARSMRALGAAFLVASLHAAGAHAQSPEKFERPVPGKPATAVPPAVDALMQDVMRKAEGKQRGEGICERVNWPLRTDSEVVELAGPQGGMLVYRHAHLKTCAVMKVGPVSVESDGIRIRNVKTWYCSNAICYVKDEILCKSMSDWREAKDRRECWRLPAAPATGQPLAKEIVRKAEANEQENGICARAAGPLAYDFDLIGKLGAAGGTTMLRETQLDNRTPRNCGFMLVGKERIEGNARIRKVTTWKCEIGGACAARSHDYCQFGSANTWKIVIDGMCRP